MISDKITQRTVSQVFENWT